MTAEWCLVYCVINLHRNVITCKRIHLLVLLVPAVYELYENNILHLPYLFANGQYSPRLIPKETCRDGKGSGGHGSVLV